MTPRGETGNDFGVRPTAEGSATDLSPDAQRDIDPMLQRLYATGDAAVWAEEFVGLFGTDTIDFGLMVGWFANAMETANRVAHEDRYDEGYNDGQRDTAHALMGLQPAEPPKPKAEDPG